MTAEVAVLNSGGVAIAADSAITISISKNNNKTYYTAQKVFNLSRKHSVGIMVYNTSAFMNIDWEIIIHEFGKALGDRVFDTLKEYADYMLTFLRDFIHVTDTLQKEYLEYLSYSFFDSIKDYYDAEISGDEKDQKIAKTRQVQILADVLKNVRKRLESETFSSGFTDDEFAKANREIIEKELDEVFADYSVSGKMKEEMIDLFFMDLVKAEIAWRWYRCYSGIVFAGYGEKEIYPSVIHFALHGRLGKNVMHGYISTADMAESNAWINPYAQTDVINTFIRGIDPYFKDEIINDLDELIGKVIGIAGKKNAEKIKKLKEAFFEKMDEFEEKNYKDPVMQIVASLPKSNLAEMAEALVNLTALRRHVSTDEESVGGPTDVALITKTDGFVWIKKKPGNVANMIGDQHE